MSAAVKINKLGKFDLNPRGNLWLKDESRFGHKLLSKMGWSQGKGLGKNEDGIKENLKVKVKAANAGIGWTEKFPLAVETAEYDAVLANLNKKFNNSTSSNKYNQENETTSIEKRSQEFKKRLHYGKFVRGKDVGRYSEKDFNSIFVTKMPKSEPKPVIECSVTNVDCPKETPENTTTFKSSLSMKDYFDMKMKKKSETTDNTATASEDLEVEVPATQNGFPDKKKSKKKKQKLISEESCHEGDSQDSNLKETEVEINAQEPTLKRKKSKKSLAKSKRLKLDSDLEEECFNGNDKDNEDVIKVYEMIQVDDSIAIDKTKKKKKPKRCSDTAKEVKMDAEFESEPSDTTVEHDESTAETSQGEIITLKDDISLNKNQEEVSSEGTEKAVKKRKRKKSKVKPSTEIDLSDDSTSSSSANEKEPQTDAADENGTLPEEQSTSSKRKKLKAKRKLSTSVMKGLKTCLKSIQQTYAVEKEARRVSFSEQVHCRLLTTLTEEGETDEVKSEINDIVLPCVNKTAEEIVESTDESPVENGTEENTPCEEPQQTLDEEEEDSEATPNCLILPKTDNSNYNSWLENQRIASKMKVYKNMVKRLKKNPVLRTTNLLDIKGYGNWGLN